MPTNALLADDLSVPVWGLMRDLAPRLGVGLVATCTDVNGNTAKCWWTGAVIEFDRPIGAPVWWVYP